jgi:phosphate starvation-inducible PhoH-like protein
MDHIDQILNMPYDLITLIFGDYDGNVKLIEKALQVSIVNRDGVIKISGDKMGSQKAKKVLKQLIKSSQKGVEINEQTVTYALDMIQQEKEEVLDQIKDDFVCLTTRGKYIRAKTIGQSQYIDAINNKMIVFAIGPAGTGKTYLAMAHAITAFKKKEVNRIIMTRPAIEAGEKLGFLPGDLQSKVDPYLRPLYDALHEIMGAEVYQANMEKGLIEVAPLAYMRGRTLDNAFIILDEAQNTTPEQMKMFLTRIGYGSKAIITGDITQKDLPDNKISGLEVASQILSSVEEIGIVELTHADIVRHPLVQKIVKAYEVYEKNQKIDKDQLRNKESIASKKHYRK